METAFKNKDLKNFVLSVVLVLACFLGYVSHSVFFFGQIIFLILLVVNPLLFGYVSKRPIMSFIVGFLPLFLMILYRLPFAAVFPSQPLDDFILLMPGALLLGAAGYFEAQQKIEKKTQNLCYLLSVLLVLAMIGFYLFIFFK
ncbi:hypothetical protein MmiEs2_12350 [Methanimicrococcus stummii]|uniref:Uncharacterized protein n=1 Tax=Methanimicrococcus stummii TaxID=3028294 RepID=A0AA96VAR7_9EURY|nr:hypothetical protein [Methanimicrococcus sp. Es2]WNY29021.1 hypothetical protein MmiEs2_12350 [Methanimicrococcus sp. Es2]